MPQLWGWIRVLRKCRQETVPRHQLAVQSAAGHGPRVEQQYRNGWAIHRQRRALTLLQASMLPTMASIAARAFLSTNGVRTCSLHYPSGNPACSFFPILLFFFLLLLPFCIPFRGLYCNGRVSPCRACKRIWLAATRSASMAKFFSSATSRRSISPAGK